MRAIRFGLVAMVGILAGVAAARALPEEARAAHAGTCAPGACRATEHLPDVPAPHSSRSDHHPCDWVETCQLPCAREATACCHAEWNCPPDLTQPRC